MLTRPALMLALAASCAPSQEPPIRVTTRLVQVSVIVHDHGGRPVADLQRDDFTLLDRGKPQKIAFFSVYSNQPARPAPTLPPGVYSNRGVDQPGALSSVTIILLDGLNTALEDQRHVRDGVIAFLEQVRPEDRVALYTLGREVRVLHDFTSSPARLLNAVARYRGRIPIELESAQAAQVDPTGDAGLDQFLQGMQDKFSDVQHEERALRTLYALEAIAGHVAALPGRKNLVWISGGFPFTLGLGPIDDSFRDPRTFLEEERRASLALSNAGVAIYPVDARGLGGRDAMASSDAHSSRRGGGRNGHAPPPVDQNLDTMTLLASRTGGRAFFNTVDFRGAIAHAVEDAKVTYTLGFYPQGEPDGRSHELKVSVQRPGLDVRFRKAYLALADAPPSPESWKAQVQRAMVSPVSSAQIGMEVRREASATRPGAYRLAVRLYGSDLPLEHQQDQWTGRLDLIVAQVRADGRVVSAATSPLRISLPEAKFKTVLEEGLRLTLNLQAAEGAAFAQVLALDEAHGRIGSIRLPLK